MIISMSHPVTDHLGVVGWGGVGGGSAPTDKTPAFGNYCKFHNNILVKSLGFY